MEQDLTESPATEQEAPAEILSPEDYVAALVRKAKSAAGRLSTLPTAVKNQALLSMADGLEEQATELLAENEKDLEQFDATPERQAMADRLRLTTERIRRHGRGHSRYRPVAGPARGHAEDVDQAERHAGRADAGAHRSDRHHLRSRPNVTADSAALCLKSGNVCILRGGSEAISFEYGHRQGTCASVPRRPVCRREPLLSSIARNGTSFSCCSNRTDSSTSSFPAAANP